MKPLIRTFTFISVAGLLCSCAGAAVANGLPRYGVVVYSNFCVSQQSSDLAGDRITLHRFADGDTVVYEYTDGSTHALIATDLKLDVKAETLSFKVNVPGDMPAAVFGQLSHNGRHLVVRGLPFRGETKSSLERVADFAAPLRVCR